MVSMGVWEYGNEEYCKFLVICMAIIFPGVDMECNSHTPILPYLPQ